MKEEKTRQIAAAERIAREQAAQEASVAHEQAIAFNARSFIEQQAAQSLAKLAHASPDIGIASDQVQSLINTLIVSS